MVICNDVIQSNHDIFLVENLINSYNDAIVDGQFDVSDHWKGNINRNASEFVIDLQKKMYAGVLNV